MIPGGDWHTDYCAKYDTFDFAGEPISTPCDCGWEDALVRIEAEARAAVLRELREEVAGMDLPASEYVRQAVLAAIDRRLGDD